jgi:hypothetical protein
LGAAVQRDDGRLVEDDPLRARVNQRVRRTEIDREIARQRVALLSRSAPTHGRFGRERAQTALELLDAVFHRVRAPVAKQDRRDTYGAGEESE